MILDPNSFLIHFLFFSYISNYFYFLFINLQTNCKKGNLDTIKLKGK